jgi:hypothetical protein
VIVAGILLSLLVTGGATAMSSPGVATFVDPPPYVPSFAGPLAPWSNPAASGPEGAGVAPAVTRLELGAFEAPAPGVMRTEGPRGDARRALSLVRASTAMFSAVGVSWRETSGVGAVEVAARGHQPGGDWGPWQVVGAGADDRDPVEPALLDAGRPPVRGGADLIWVGQSDGVELVVTVLSGRSPHGIVADLVDPKDVRGDALVESAAPTPGSARVAMPPVVRRAAWGANERETTWRPRYARSLQAVVFHHTATANNYAPADVPKIMRAIYHYQTVSRGWGDIGYNVLVDRFGRLWEGRAGGLSRPVVGAQAGGFNTGTAGLAVIGDFRSVPVPPAAVESAARYVAWKLSLGPAADPRGSVTMTGGGPLSRFPAGTTVTAPRVFPHRQTSPTECPGARGMDALPLIRDRAAAILGDLVRPSTVRTRLAVWRTADATFRVYGSPGGPVFTGTPGDQPAVADYDGDGVTDLAAFSPATGTWKITTSSDAVTNEVKWGLPGDRPVPADYDGDGRAEIAVWRPSNGVWYERGIGELAWGAPGDVPVPADYTGDGLADPAVFRPSAGTWYVQGGGQYRLGEAWHVPVPGDYDGDGVVEPAAWSPVTYRFFVWGQAPVRFGAAGDVPVPAQYDGDGHVDFAVFHTGPGGRTSWQVRGIASYDTGAPGDVPVPLR